MFARQAAPQRSFAAATVLALVLAIASWLTVITPAPANAAITSPFTQVYSANTSGGIQIRGNTVETCEDAATACAAARANLVQNNNAFFMNYVDTDSDSTTFDSSSSTVNIPTGATVLFAALTWGGPTYAGGSISGSTATYGSGTPAAAPNASANWQVKLMVAGASSYQTVSSTRTNSASGSYQAYANITSLVQAAGNGSYTVANVQAGTGTNSYAGWGLTIAYSNPSDPPRNLTIFVGFGSVAANDQVDIPVSGFLTPPSGAVVTTLGAISYEGDAGSTGDQMQLGNTTSSLANVTDSLHPVANTFTSVISDLGADSSSRTPKYKNQLGYDEATFNVNGFLANNSTSGDIRLTSNTGGETYYPGVVTFATNLYSPSLTATKSVAVAQKASGNTMAGVPEPGDTLRYTIATTNAGFDDAINTTLTDTVPAGTTYVAGSLAAGSTSLSDAAGDDIGSYTSGTQTVRVNLGTGATAAAGGTVATGLSAATITFEVTVNSNIADGATITNTALLSYTGSQTGLSITGGSNAVIAAAVRHHSQLSITKTANLSRVQKGAATPVTYTLTALNSGPYGDPAVTITDNLPAGATVVSATPSAGTCTTPTGQVVCTVGAMANGATATVAVVVHLDGAADPATDTATVLGTNVDDNPADSTASVSTAVNTAPVAVNDSATTSGGVATVNVLANDSDVDGDPLTVTLGSTAPAKGTVVVNSDQTITYTANAGTAGADTFSYVINDGRGGTATGTVTVTIPDAPPQAQPDATTTTPGTPVTINVLTNDTDPNIPTTNQTLTVTALTQPAVDKGTATTNGTIVTFTPATTFGRGTATFTYTVSDGAGGTDTATITVTIPNQAPVAANDSASTPYLTPVTVDVLNNDTDPNGDPLTVTAVTTPNHGTATITGTGPGTRVRYTPATGWSGSDTVTYTITDGTLTDTAHLTITTGDAAPTAGSYSTTVPGATATTLNVLAHASDPNGDTLTVTGTTSAAHGSITVDSSGNIIYTPESSYAGTDSFTYTVDDGLGGTATGVVTITVANQPPHATDDTATAPLNGTTTIDVLANDTDPNNDPLTITAVGTPTHGTASLNNDGTITYAATAGYLGSDSFTYTVSDGHGGTSTATVSVTVANQPPVAVNDTATASGLAGSPVTIDVLANDSDPNGDPLSITAVSTPAHGSAVIAGGELTYTPLASYAGTDTFTYTISDGRGGLSTATVTVNVVNRPPVAVPDSFTAATAIATTLDVLSNDHDPDGEALSVQSVDSTSAHGAALTITVAGRISYTSPTAFTGTDTFGYVVADPRGGTDTALVTVSVSNANPTAPNRTATTSLHTPITLNLLAQASDPDGQTVSVTSVGTPTHGIATLNNDGTVSYQPSAGYAGVDTFSYTISDGEGGTATGTVTVTISDAPPQAQPDATTTTPGTPVTINVLANDTDPNIPTTNQTLTVTALTQPAVDKGTATTNGTTVTFTPATTFGRGTATFTYTVSDGAGGTDNATITVTIPNDAPVAADDTATTPYLTPVTVDVLSNDTDPNGDPLTVTTVGTATHGTATLNNNGTITYTPQAGFTGTDGFAYAISDGAGGTAAGIVTVTVSGGPQAVGDTVTTLQGSAVLIAPLANDSPGLGASIVAASVVLVDPSNQSTTTDLHVANIGHYVVALDGTITFTPDPSYSGTTSITYRFTDSAGHTATALISLTVTPVVPVAVNDTASTAASASVTVDVLANDHGGDQTVPLVATSLALIEPGTAHAVTAVTVSGVGSYVVTTAHRITFSPAHGFSGIAAITYSIADVNGSVAHAVVSVSVGASDPPRLTADSVTGIQGLPVTIHPLDNDHAGMGQLVASTTVLLDPDDPAHPSTHVRVVGVGSYDVSTDGTVLFAPVRTFTGSSSITYEVTDDDLNTAASTITTAITPVVPRATNDQITVTPGVRVTIDVLANDRAGDLRIPLDPSTVRLIDPGTERTTGHAEVHGAGAFVVTSDGTIRFSSEPALPPTSTIAYTVADANGTIARADIVVTARGPASIVVTPDSATSVGAPVPMTPLSNDRPTAGAHWLGASLCLVNPSTLTCSDEVTVADVGTWRVLADHTVRFVPVPGFLGIASLRYRATDSAGYRALSTLTVRVLGATVTSTGGQLADTGVPTIAIVELALTLLLSGAALCCLARRRATPRFAGQHRRS